MPLTEEQKSKLREAAIERDVDPDALIAEAERQSQSSETGTAPSSGDKPTKTDKPLYMYHLPFVTVNEVRTIWLGLSPIAGGDEYAAKFAAAQTASQAVKSDAPAE